MLAIPVTLLPGGDPERAEALGYIEIFNITPGRSVCDYIVQEADGRRELVRNHRRSDGWMKLLARACTALDR